MAPSNRVVFLGCGIASVLATTLPDAHGSLFLERREAPAIDLLHELGSVVGHNYRNIAESRVGDLELMLRPMVAVMPKNAAGNLDAPAARYVLHRLFVQRHGWFVRGFDAAGDAWNSSSPAKVFMMHAGGRVHDLFDDQLRNHGLALRQLAIFAATFETFVHAETLERLDGAYRVLNVSTQQETFDAEGAARTIRTYMLMYVLRMDHNRATGAELAWASQNVASVYPTWADTQGFVREVQESVLGAAVRSRTSRHDVLQVVEEVGNRYGRWQDKECRSIKRALLDLEESGTGRVPLTTFYGSALRNESWQFVESIAYLRELGALDESDPRHLRVIIPNYVNSPSNCVASSRFYDVCCIDECDALLSHLEERLGTPSGEAGAIAELVADLPSNTVPAPRRLAASLTQRLESIAVHHNGRVPLHGRLFAQWMHHAYPRECVYPHVSGTTKRRGIVEFVAETRQRVAATTSEMEVLVEEQAGARTLDDTENDLPWSTEEELIVSRPPPQSDPKFESRHAGRSMMMFVALFSAVLTLARAFSSARDNGDDAKKMHHLM